MNANTLRCILAAAILSVSAPLVAQGETALRRYLASTSGTQPLRWEDVTVPKAQPVSDTGTLPREPKKHANQYR